MTENPDAVETPSNSEAVEEGRARAEADAAARGVSIRIAARPAARSLEEAASLLGIEPSAIVKTLVVKRSDGTFVFALVPGGRKISWPKLRAVLSVNKLQLPDAQVAFDATGYVRGTITPFGSTTAWPVVADSTIVGRTIALGAGAPGYSLFAEADDVIAAFTATVADITDAE
ncbi:aminoacyl-tRNA deacylase [Leifsonia poae]|uniref:aminoacyl-tRNA deacylase n=1 Tax=Leifsonia poae TaxID=110933 RepID=UPI003D66D1DF